MTWDGHADVQADVLNRDFHVDVQASVLASIAASLRERAPDKDLHYWVVMEKNGSYPQAVMHIGRPGRLGERTTVYSFTELNWPVCPGDVDVAVARLLKSVLAERGSEQERQEADREAGPAEPAGAALPGSPGDRGGPGEEDHGDDDEPAGY